MATQTVLAAYYSPKGAPSGKPEVEITEIEPGTGNRRWIAWSVCSGKREARKYAAQFAATPWNF